MNDLAMEIKRAAQQIAVLHMEVLERQRSSPSMVKRVPFFSAVPFRWTVPDMQLQTRPWVNGAEDAYITALTYACTLSETEEIDLFGVNPGEFGIAGVRGEAGPVIIPMLPAFDFEWNYTIQSSGLTYVSQANGAMYADRRALGNIKRNEPLSFRDPLVIPAGDAMVWKIRPRAYSPNPTMPLTQTVDLAIILCGYRTGTMAEADYERR